MKEQFKNLEQLIKTEYGNIAGIVIQKNGEPVYESYFNGCTDQKRVHIFSVTKSIISLLIGMAIGKGYIQSVSRKVLEFFPDYTIRQREHTIQHITLEHLLTMTAPYKYRYAPYTKYFSSPDWVVSALNQLGGRDPIGEFRYAPLIGPDILTGIIARASSMSVSAFAEKYLFEPLGISTPPNITFHNIEEQTAFYNAPYSNCWVCDSMGNNTAGWGLTLSARDMTKLGQQ